MMSLKNLKTASKNAKHLGAWASHSRMSRSPESLGGDGKRCALKIQRLRYYANIMQIQLHAVSFVWRLFPFRPDPFLFWGQSLKSCVECCGSMWIIVARCDPWFVCSPTLIHPEATSTPLLKLQSLCSEARRHASASPHLEIVWLWNLFTTKHVIWYIEYIHVYTVHTHTYIYNICRYCKGLALGVQDLTCISLAVP